MTYLLKKQRNCFLVLEQNKNKGKACASATMLHAFVLKIEHFTGGMFEREKGIGKISLSICLVYKLTG
ncbi:hypothetical protein SAMN05192534_102203 [Alteribacillus persepolensis]|uniref:Uncharacterized protein n=1 Tax=Alteribacillus persepolensis TaxID=568899 RepID=A0A1G8AMG5_9BACI|nr:hypothetical protein SAMN05192534_102203 [Alteribacillus persepolensis]